VTRQVTYRLDCSHSPVGSYYCIDNIHVSQVSTLWGHITHINNDSIIPIRLNWALTLVCSDEYSELLDYTSPQCQTPLIQSKLSQYNALCALVQGVLGKRYALQPNLLITKS
jgi:hypothetical protein